MASEVVIDLVEQRLQDRDARSRLLHHPVVSQVIESTVGQLLPCPDFVTDVREQLEPIIASAVRFLAYCQDVQRGPRTSYLFDPSAKESDLADHLVEWFRAVSFTDLVIEAQEIAAGRIDLMFTFQGFRFVVELKREQDDASRKGIGRYLAQTVAYQATDVAVAMLIVLDLTAGPLPDHIRDQVWVDVIAASTPGGTDRYVVVIRVPGNRLSPSRLSRG